MSAIPSVLIEQKSRLGARIGSPARIAALALLLAACSDARVTEPALEATPFTRTPSGRMPAGIPTPDVIVHSVATDSTSAEFTVTPTGGVFQLGPHAIYFPANAICDPATSTYGPTEWDAPCEVLTEPIRFRAEVRSLDGRSWIDFSPAVRFVPTDEPANAVWLYMKTASLSEDPDSVAAVLKRMSVLYSPAIGVPGIDEAATDPSLVTYVWLKGGIAFRRIKHFSGYNVYDGRSEDVEYVEGLVMDIAF